MKVEFINLKQCGLAPRQALARLAAWHQAQGARVLVLALDQAQAQELDQLLWTHDPASFLPHALAGGPDQEQEPVLIACQPAGLEAGRVAILAQAAAPLPGEGCALCQVLVPGQEGPELTACRALYKELAQRPGLELAHTTSLPG